MIVQLLSVQRSGVAANSRPRIQLCGNWLPEMGFVDGALVQSLPEPEGFVFNLCNDNVNYSDLYHSTKARGGTLIRVSLCDERNQSGVALITAGKHITAGGLKFGDSLIAKCEYGCIRVRKVGGSVRLIHVARTKNDRTGAVMPHVFILGDWLSGIGFPPDTLVTVYSDYEGIIFTAHGEEIIYRNIVKYARQNKMRLIQVSTKNGIPLISVTGTIVDRAGFGLDDIFTADYGEYGIIKLQKLDLGRFGFSKSL